MAAVAPIRRHQERRQGQRPRKAMCERRTTSFFGHYFAKKRTLQSAASLVLTRKYVGESNPGPGISFRRIDRGGHDSKERRLWWFLSRKRWGVLSRRMDRSLLAETPPNIFGIGRMSSSLLKTSIVKRQSNPRPPPPPSSSTAASAPPSSGLNTEQTFSQKLEDALAVESLVRQITEWDTICNE